MNYNPTHKVYEQALRSPGSLALYADDTELDYAELLAQVCSLAAILADTGVGRGSRVGILGSRSLLSIRAMLAVTWCGATYVPLSVRWPAERLASALERTGLDALVVDRHGHDLLSPKVCGLTRVLLSGCPLPELADSARHVPVHVNLEAAQVSSAVHEPAAMARDDLAYITFTSGTTGIPKGVMAACASVMAYLKVLAERKALVAGDRASQFTELSFDPSIGEVYLPLWVGASLHVVPPVSHVSPVNFIRERQLTVWGSTPAAIAWMRDTRSLRPGCLSGLRYSSFGGEPLTLASVMDWRAAAPNSEIDNFYGPTEATVDCCGQRVGIGEQPVVTPERGILAIGVPHPGTELAIFTQDREQLPAGEVGELGIAGVQLTEGYLDQPDLTRERFPTIDGKRWYLTGDLARRDSDGNFHHIGRIDNQVKIHGYRVELEDIEAQLRVISGADAVAAVAWPVRDGVAHGIVGFVTRASVTGATLRAQLRSRLPPHMIPAKIVELGTMPINASGKIDRATLLASLESPGA